MPLKIRTEKPPKFLDYKSYKKYLRVEFNFCCAYCNVREPEMGGSQSFHIDHYAPKQQFPEKISDYLNLFYSCRVCNAHKGNFWPNKEQKESGQFILNPCDHDLDKHFDQKNDEWIANSKTARWNVVKLRLNSPANIRRRRDRKIILVMIKDKKNQVCSVKQLLTEVEENTQEKIELKIKLSKIEDEIDMLTRRISGPLD